MQTAADEIPDESLPAYGNFNYTVIPNYGRRDIPPRYQVNHGPMFSPPGYSSPRTGAASAPNHVQLHYTSPLDVSRQFHTGYHR